ncbi:MAG: hypothetical protein HXK04_08105, partial [Actinomyces graevenitzii]|nr:hypothetical protein [Actinomyces graevenitzii]
LYGRTSSTPWPAWKSQVLQSLTALVQVGALQVLAMPLQVGEALVKGLLMTAPG